jgi:hypothetical protein
MQAKRMALACVGYGLRCVLRSSGSAHVTQIASQICVARCSLTVSQYCAARGTRHRRGDCKAGIARSLKQKCTIEHRSERRVTLVCRLAIAHRASWLRPAALGSGSLCSPASDAGESKRCNSITTFRFCLPGANANHLPAISSCLTPDCAVRGCRSSPK